MCHLRLDVYLSVHHWQGLSSLQPYSNFKLINAGESVPVD